MPDITIPTPTGPFRIWERDGAIVRTTWGAGQAAGDETVLLQSAQDQIAAYFAQELQIFDLPLVVDGSEFQQQVCAAMLAIPYGQTRTYGEIAKDLNAAAQPVGTACGTNPIPLIIPCHRVLGANGLGGFSGGTGVETKAQLLQLEGQLLI